MKSISPNKYPKGELSKTDIDLHAWLAGFKDTEDSVTGSLTEIK